jgi:hypothetical protein
VAAAQGTIARDNPVRATAADFFERNDPGEYVLRFNAGTAAQRVREKLAEKINNTTTAAGTKTSRKKK